VEADVHWLTSRFTIDLSLPQVMGIVNITPDSFSDGGNCSEAHAALRHCEALLREGAAMLDLGAESSRPGAPRIEAETEWARLQPVLVGALKLGVPVSVDTCKPLVMQRALDHGVDVINDIQALATPGAMEVVAAHPRAGVCLMHMRGDPSTMQSLATYQQVVDEVRAALESRCQELIERGVRPDRIALDPGFGFAKLPQQNMDLTKGLSRIVSLGHPVLVGWSRKSTLGWITGRSVGDRLPASLAAALVAVQQGARILRVHDVGPTVDALRVWLAAGQWPVNESSKG
jgi:dihydropteroate synthase